jgi:hypothetical protein
MHDKYKEGFVMALESKPHGEAILEMIRPVTFSQ